MFLPGDMIVPFMWIDLFDLNSHFLGSCNPSAIGFATVVARLITGIYVVVIVDSSGQMVFRTINSSQWFKANNSVETKRTTPLTISNTPW